MLRPWLSVISPIYNGEAYLSSALDSILIQQDNSIECIAVDGESTDSTLSILQEYQSKLPLKILNRNRETNWVTKTNYALSRASGEYICFLHHDDLWFKDRLKIMRHLTEEFPQATFFIHPSMFLDVNGNHVGLWSCPLPPSPTIIKPELMIERLLIQNFISILGPVFRRDTAINVGGLDESLWYTADWDFWLKISACGDTVYYPKPLSGFRIHSSSQTMVRSSYLEDFYSQLERVEQKHLSLWGATKDKKNRVRKVAEFSIIVNSTLAGASHGVKPKILEIFVTFFLLGPSGWHRYIRDSRIYERVSARLKVGLSKFSKS